jgi:Spy/CpxP family protein refolding chaperone
MLPAPGFTQIYAFLQALYARRFHNGCMHFRIYPLKEFVMINRHVARTRLLLAGVALSMPLVLLAEPMKMAGMPYPGMPMHSARCVHGGHFEHGMDPVPPFLHEANLDEAQRDKIFLIMHAQMPQLREQEKTRFKARQALAGLGMSGQYSDAKAKALADTLARATAEIALIRARSDSQIVALLTPEQRAALDKSRNERGAMPPPCVGPRD